MRAQSIYNMFCSYCRGLKDDVEYFKSNGNNSIIIFMKKLDRPLVFTVIEVNRGFWTLEPLR